ncbi:hypothetical protein LJR084_006992 [Variovorax sp. LjRoot84]|uniref:hypothetical protein n=1 Tax=Variovorax sp. LjRoot84 TaxID=3342340 RepID=UPI003ECC3DDE
METEDLADEQLAASAHVWRRKAFHGEKHASSVALHLRRGGRYTSDAQVVHGFVEAKLPTIVVSAVAALT